MGWRSWFCFPGDFLFSPFLRGLSLGLFSLFFGGFLKQIQGLRWGGLEIFGVQSLGFSCFFIFFSCSKASFGRLFMGMTTFCLMAGWVCLLFGMGF